ncbi:hypothetical protein EDEG_03796 [Edhazardia aedis USNM 41457]|uniref:Uncharacterized protein n=1 Tax=Edhazardia aedis (strain USNM 41457) TaxID=1003232 RepID=J9D260_EDHAE|nr:hypothetical protein EDEG_03796 [Edhazardia aedis USNM 41457]|eukprot:EJW01664.1 hypothetical protein EDEG_03796 [Edhazardia aedis USNM 41457]
MSNKPSCLYFFKKIFFIYDEFIHAVLRPSRWKHHSKCAQISKIHALVSQKLFPRNRGTQSKTISNLEIRRRQKKRKIVNYKEKDHKTPKKNRLKKKRTQNTNERTTGTRCSNKLKRI